jgi:hypothetical protein
MVQYSNVYEKHYETRQVILPALGMKYYRCSRPAYSANFMLFLMSKDKCSHIQNFITSC